jgi:predicted RNA-binding Zn-ribbon protein involved in translation (DUF1610 family)
MSDQANAMSVAGVMPFDCPNCGAQYKVVCVETDRDAPDEQLTCRKCGMFTWSSGSLPQLGSSRATN